MAYRMPQAFDRVTTFRFHISFLLALLPVVAFSAWQRGWPVLLLVSLSMVSAWGFDEALRRFRRVNEPQDWGALLWGLLLALLLPSNAPWYLPVLGSAFAILVVKGLFGGGGVPWINPVLIAWAFLQAGWSQSFYPFPTGIGGPDSVYGLEMTNWLNTNAFSWFSIQLPPGYIDLFLGLSHTSSALIVESGGLFLLAATIFLLAKGYFPWEVPVFFFLTFSIPTALMGGDVLFQVFSGTFLLNLFFLASDPSSRPLGRLGLILFASGVGFVSFLIRTWGLGGDGVGYAVLLMNLLVPWLDQRMGRKSLNDFRLA